MIASSTSWTSRRPSNPLPKTAWHKIGLNLPIRCANVYGSIDYDRATAKGTAPFSLTRSLEQSPIRRLECSRIFATPFVAGATITRMLTTRTEECLLGSTYENWRHVENEINNGPSGGLQAARYSKSLPDNDLSALWKKVRFLQHNVSYAKTVPRHDNNHRAGVHLVYLSLALPGPRSTAWTRRLNTLRSTRYSAQLDPKARERIPDQPGIPIDEFLRRHEPRPADPLGRAVAQDRRLGARPASPRRRATPQAEPFAPLSGQERRAAGAAAGRGLRPGPRGRPADARHAALRRADCSAASPCSTARSSRCRPARARRSRPRCRCTCTPWRARAATWPRSTTTSPAATPSGWGRSTRRWGCRVGVIETQMPQPQRRKAYACDVTYGTAKEFGFDFLRDRLLLRRIGEGQTDLLGGMLGQQADGRPTRNRSRASRTSPWSTRPTAS